MKKSLLISFLFFLIFSFQLPVSAEQDVEAIQRGAYPLVKNKDIVQALDCLAGTDGEWARRAIAGFNNSNRPIKVLYKNLTTISPEFKGHFAVGWKDESGNLLIFISDEHKNAPYQALAALLCHESIHQDDKNSISEETYGWTYEAEIWMQLKNKYPELKQLSPGENSLVDRLNLMEMLFRKANFKPTLIEREVRSNLSYKSLPETSPGFGL